MHATFQGIVLGVAPHREYDRRYSVLTAEHGKVRFIAQGARRPTAKLAPSIGPLSRGVFSVVSGRVHDRLTGYEADAVFNFVDSDLFKIGCARYFAHITDRLVGERSGVNDEYDLLLEALSALERMKDRVGGQRLIAAYSLQLLTLLGWRPDVRALRARAGVKEVVSRLMETPLSNCLEVEATADVGRSVVRVVDRLLARQLEQVGVRGEIASKTFLREIVKV